MYKLQGFFTYSPLVDNTRDEVALFGELSSDSLTYAKDKTYHTNDAAPQTTLVVFDSREDDTYAPVPSTFAVAALTVGQWLLDRAVSGTLSSDPADILRNLQAEFSSLIQDINCGNILTEGDITLPEWISFDGVGADADKTVSVWLFVSDH